MCQISLAIPNEVMYDTKMNTQEVSEFIQRGAAMCFYVQRGVSIGYCAKIAGMTEEDFIKYLGENNVSIFHYDDEAEFIEELQNA